MEMTRRTVLGLAIGGTVAAVGVGCAQADSGGAERVRYGDAASQFFELSRPEAVGPVPVIVVLHGGFWRDQYDLGLMRPLVPDLLSRGWAVANVEYRRLGEVGGGWPGTFADVGAAVDRLAELDGVDPSRVVGLGHSAGGHLAVWAASRGVLPAGAVGADPRIGLVGAVAQAGVLDLATAAEDRLGGGAVTSLLGGGPDAVPEVYRMASPVELLPTDVPVELLHATDDALVPFDQSARFAEIARSYGDAVKVTEVPGGHFELIEPGSEAWRRTLEAVGRRMG